MKKFLFKAIFLGVLVLIPIHATTQTPALRKKFTGSIRTIQAATSTEKGQKGHRPALVNASLTSAQLSKVMEFEVALKMHNLTELQARVAHNEKITPHEMAAKYWPTKAEHDAVIEWLKAQGFSIVRTDTNHLGIFAQGKVSDVQAVLQTQFARVIYDNTEYTSAVTAPSIPTTVADYIVGIHGLQPHAHMTPRHTLLPQASATNAPPYLPAQIQSAYNASGLAYTGSGQIIGIISNAYPSSSDLTKFWNAAGVTVPSSNIVQVNINGGPAIPADSNSTAEACLDVEWASALAPGATIMVYGSNINDPAGFDKTYQQIYNDAQTHTGLSQFSLSFGENETLIENDYLVIESQYMANLASTGITILAASGDGGSNPDPATGSYVVTAPVDVSYPACDPSVTGVGGTHLVFNSSGTVSSESSWNNSGGGPSRYYLRPSWQTGLGITQGTYRLTPDVAAVGDPQTGATVYINGAAQTMGGTSLSTPIWAAFCAVINQARSANKLSPLGYLNPRIYPLLNSIAFRDVTSGNNGAFTATTGYDQCTGIGVPNVANIIQATLLPITQPPSLTTSTGNRFTTSGQSASFAVAVVGPQNITYQWQRAASGTSQWISLSDSGNYSGSTTAILTVSNSTLAMSGDQFRCIASNPYGSTTSLSLSLTVSTSGMSTLAGWPGAAGFLDGVGTAARFDCDGGIRLDSSGNIYVADSVNNAIRKVTPSGVVTTVLGASGNAGSTDGPVASASINGPGGVALDSSGNIYIADSLNYTIRKISTTGIVSTLAGSPGLSGKTDGVGSAARFEDPENLAVDSSGNVWVADGQGCTVREISPNGTVTTIAGRALTPGTADATGTAARFGTLLGITVDSSGNVFVSDSSNNTIRKIAPGAIVTTLAGSPGLSGSTDATGSAARFYTPSGLTVDSAGNLFITDSSNNTIRKLTAQGVVTTVAGSPGVSDSADGIGSQGHLNNPGDIAIDTSGNLFVADFYNNTVRKIVPTLLTAPLITSQPTSLTAYSGTPTVFNVSASGSSLTYQWSFNGIAISGATASAYTIPSTTAANAGSYSVSVSNSAGTILSNTATLTVISSTGAPSIVTQPSSTSVTQGSPVTFTVSASGSSLTYQWFFNNVAIAGATSANLTIPSVTSASTGSYTVIATNALGSVTSSTAVLTLRSNPGRLTNLSVLSMDGPNSQLLTIGFVTGGAGTSGSQNLLIRGSGPALTAFNVTNPLPDPTLSVYSNSTIIASNDNWGTPSSNATAVAAANASTGAFAYASTSSLDAALVTSVATGSYTAQIAGKNTATGFALAEVYDTTPSGSYTQSTPRLVNISCLEQVSAGGTLSAGFVIGGTTNEQVLIRASGPSLTTFGLAGVMTDPKLTVYNSSSTVLATNTGWAGSTLISAANTTTGAFQFSSTSSKDSAVLLTLSPGAYTVQATSASSTAGLTLIEVYEVPTN